MTTFLSSQQLFYLRNNFFFFATTFLSSRQLFYLRDNFLSSRQLFIFVTTFLSSQQLFYLRNNIFISATTTNETMCQGSSVNCNNAITFSQQQSNSRQFLGLVTLSLKLWRVPSSDRKKYSNLGTHGTSHVY